VSFVGQCSLRCINTEKLNIETLCQYSDGRLCIFCVMEHCQKLNENCQCFSVSLHTMVRSTGTSSSKYNNNLWEELIWLLSLHKSFILT
jgi:hypothetical protein